MNEMLPEVEEAIATQDGQSIVMTWKQISIDCVRYWIQVYCNEQRAGEPVATRYSTCRIENPEPGSRYTFIVWAERDGVQSKHRTLSRNFIMVHLAGEKDSEMEMNGCRVWFPRGTFKEMTRVWMSVGSSYFVCPEEYFPVTPVMGIDPKSQLHRDAAVQMRSSCVNVDKFKFDLLQCEDLDRMEWTSITPQCCAKDKLIEFQCKEFSPWLVTTIRSYVFGPVNEECVAFVMNIFLYIKDDQFRYVVIKNSGNEENRVRVEMDCIGARLAEVYEQCVIRPGDRITFKPWVDGRPNPPKFTPCGDDYVTLDSDMLQRDYHTMLFQLEETVLQDEERFFIRCNIFLNDKKVDKGVRFKYPLKPLPSVLKPVQIINQNSASGISVAGERGNVALQDSEIDVQATSSS